MNFRGLLQVAAGVMLLSGVCLNVSYAGPDANGDGGEKKAPGKRKLQGVGFETLDKNGDGSLADDEIPERMKRFVDKIDANSDGKISKDEFQVARRRAEEKAKGKKAAGKSKSLPDPSEKPNPDGDAAEKVKAAEGTAVAKPAKALDSDEKPAAKGKKKPKGESKKSAKGKFAALEALFTQHDTDGDGKLSAAEAPERMKQNFDRIDADKDGKITKEEITVAFRAMKERGEGKAADKGGPGGAKRIFNEQDLDADGRLDRKEAKGRFADHFDQLDADKDGKLSLQELESAASKKE
jgi:Ca2+-binding EF-hand superfamily protein